MDAEPTPTTPVQPARESLMQVEREQRPDAVILHVTGEVDMLSEPRLSSALAAAFGRLEGRPLVLDLTAVTFLGSMGLRALVEACDRARDEPGYQTLRVVVDHARPVIRPIELTGLDDLLALYHTIDDALAI